MDKVGKSIRIYLANGGVTGIRHGEIVNWTGQAIACPRTRFPELKVGEGTYVPYVFPTAPRKKGLTFRPSP